MICRCSSILRHVDFHAGPRNLPFAAEFAAAEKRRVADYLFLLHLYLIQVENDRYGFSTDIR